MHGRHRPEPARAGLSRSTRLSQWSEEDGVEIIGLHHDGKGDKERTLPVPTRLASELRHRPVGWLFPGGAEGYCGVDFVAKRIRTATGWPSHSLRRQFVTVSYYRSGCNIVLVSRMRGRSNIATTMRYIGLVQNEMRTTIEATARTDMHTDRITNAFIGKVS